MSDTEGKDQEENTSANEQTESSSIDTKSEAAKDESVSNKSYNADISTTEANIIADNSNTENDGLTKTTEGGNTVAETNPKEELYDIQDLIDNCKALGYRKEVVAGALFNCKKEKMSKDEFNQTIEDFLGKKVK